MGDREPLEDFLQSNAMTKTCIFKGAPDSHKAGQEGVGGGIRSLSAMPGHSVGACRTRQGISELSRGSGRVHVHGRC